jgi:hypothetical protein
MPVNPSAAAGFAAQLLDNNGVILSGGKIYTYAAGTTTPQVTYTSATGLTQHANPIQLDSAGRVPGGEIWLTGGASYKFLIETSTGSLLGTYDNITGINDLSSVTTSLSSANVSFLQAGANAVTRTAQSKMRDVVSVKDFGAVGDNVADDTAAIQAAANYAASIGGSLFGPAGTYKVTSTISLVCDGDMSCMTLSANGGSVSPVVRFGTTTGGPTENKIMSLPRVVNNARVAGVWGVGIGIELANCNQCMFTVPSVTQFEIGLTCGGYTNGFAHNTVTLGYVYSNKVQLRLRPAGSGGWCNQNTFINGRLGFNTTDFTTSGYVGTRMILLDKGAASAGGPNTNTFVGTSVESDLVEYMVEFKENTAYNVFLNGRYEGATPKVLFATNTASGNIENLFVGGYALFGVQFDFTGTGSSPLNNVIGSRRNSIRGSGVVFNISNDSTSGIAGPHLQGFEAGTEVLNKTSAATDWAYRLFAQGFSGKRSTDAHPRIELDYVNGRIYLGAGSGALTEYIGLLGSSLTTTRSFVPATDNNRANGDASFRWSDTFSTNFRPGAGGPIWTSGAGTPEGAVTAPVGSLFTRTDGGAGTTLYIKEAGSGNTGWVAK